MLAKRNRLTAVELREILKKGRSVHSGVISVKYLPAKQSKAAVVVSKSVVKSATKRNRIRRLVYRSLRTCLPRGVYVVLFVRNRSVGIVDVENACSKLS